MERLTLASPRPYFVTLPRRARAEIRRRGCWTLYIKPHAIIANEEYDLTPGTSAPDPNHGWIVGTRPGGVKIGKIEAYCLPRDRRAVAGQGS
jgi:hypothetical protein